MSDKKFNSAIFSSSRGMGKIDPKERFRKELEREKMIERMKLAEKEDVLVRKKELCYQLKGAFPDIKQLILQAVAQRDLVSFAYNYYRSIFCEYADNLDLKSLELGCSLLSETCNWGLSPKSSILDIYVPQEYKRDDRLGDYSVKDLIGCALEKIKGTRDFGDDFFDNHCRYE